MKINAKHFEKLSKLKRALCGPSVLELARFTGEPSIHQNDAAIYSWTSIKCQKFFSIFHFPFDFLFLFLLPRCGPLQTWCNQIESDTWDRGMVRLAAVSIVYAPDYVNDIGLHATPLLCLAANAVAKKLLIHCGVAMFQLFSPADTPP